MSAAKKKKFCEHEPSSNATDKSKAKAGSASRRPSAENRKTKLEMQFLRDRIQAELKRSDEACEKAARILELWLNKKR